MKQKALLIIAGTLFFIACGENSSLSDSEVVYEQADIFSAIDQKVKYEDYLIDVTDDPIIGANISAYECKTFEELKDYKGKYLLKDCVARPKLIEAKGGYISSKDVNQTFPLIINTSNLDQDSEIVISPFSTILATASENEIEDFANKLGVSKEELLYYPQNNDTLKKLMPKINSILLASYENGVISNKVKFLEVVRKSIINNINDSDININKVVDAIESSSIAHPEMFGIVFIKDLALSNNDLLDEVKEYQNRKKVRFLGLVFDKAIANADIRVYRADNNETLIDNVKSDNRGKFILDVNDSVLSKINNNDFIIVFEAKNNQNVLTSTISSIHLREILKNSRNITPSKDINLIISNVTTVKHAMLKKRDALNNNKEYIENLKDITTYHNDKVLEASAVIKDIIDNNNSDILDNNNTFEFVYKSLDDDLNLSESITKANTTISKDDLENSILSSSIFQKQLNYLPKIDKLNFENVSKKEGNRFYRILAYYKNNKFIREYDDITTLEGYYKIKKCYLEGNNTKNWRCEKSYISKRANFNNGDYKIVDNNYLISYSLNSIKRVEVDELCKNYYLYSVNINKIDLNGNEKTDVAVLVDSYDVVDMFRRMPNEDKKSFQDLENRVSNKSREEVNFELNRFINEKLKDVDDYFTDDNKNNNCK